MAFEDRSYSGNAVPATLTANINNTATSIPISTATGWADGTSGPFHVGIALASAPDTYIEVVRCSGRTGLTLNVQTVPTSGRGWDGTVAQSHLTGAAIVPVFTATDADEANQHYSNVGLDHHTQYLTVGRHDLSARHGIGVLPTGGAPSTSLQGDTAQAGTSGTLSRSDHKHARESFGITTSLSAPGDAAAVGASTSVARADHVHGREAFGGDGAATTVARSDHIHSVVVVPTVAGSNGSGLKLEGDIACATGTEVAILSLTPVAVAGTETVLMHIRWEGQVRAATSSAGEVRLYVGGTLFRSHRWHNHGDPAPLRYSNSFFWAVYNGYNPLLELRGSVDASGGAANYSMSEFVYQFVLNNKSD